VFSTATDVLAVDYWNYDLCLESTRKMDIK